MFIRNLYRRFKLNKKIAEFKKVALIGDNVNLSQGFSFKIENNSVKIGNNTRLNGFFVTKEKGKIEIGDYCSFRVNTYIGSLSSIKIGNHVFGAPNIFICDNNNHPVSPKLRKEMTFSPTNTKPWKWDSKIVECAPIIIEDCVWLGRNTTILKGVTIGRGSIVAAGSVVTKDVPPFTVIAGNPAKVVKIMENDLDD